eukprot:12565532-Heterocapsa_arctica.AAC.1
MSPLDLHLVAQLRLSFLHQHVRLRQQDVVSMHCEQRAAHVHEDLRVHDGPLPALVLQDVDGKLLE